MVESLCPAPNRHEWLIRGENVKLCVWFGMVRGLFYSDRAPLSSRCKVWLDSPLTATIVVLIRFISRLNYSYWDGNVHEYFQMSSLKLNKYR